MPLSSAALAGLPPALYKSLKKKTLHLPEPLDYCLLIFPAGEICCVPGSFQAPWCSLGECGEQYCLVWESRFLRDLGSALASLLDGLVSIVAQEALKYTVLSGQWGACAACVESSVSLGATLTLLLLSRHRGGSDVAGVSAGSGQRHRPPLVRVSEPLG